jgi:hypothetical protein
MDVGRTYSWGSDELNRSQAGRSRDRRRVGDLENTHSQAHRPTWPD